jgi:Cytochrome c oxidase subunit IV
MKVEGLVFSVFTSFLGVTAIVYWYTSKDPTGTAALAISAGLGLLIGGYLLMTAKRLGPRPSDLDDAEVADGAGDVGHFSPGSYWPFFISLFTAVTLVGAIVGIWLALLGAIATFATLMGLMFEYYVNRLSIEEPP